MDTPKRIVGSATMDDTAMEMASRDAIASAIAAQKAAQGVAVGPTVKVRVRTSRAHFRAGKFWPTLGEDERPALTVADVPSDKLPLLLADAELLVEVLEQPPEPASEPKGTGDPKRK